MLDIFIYAEHVCVVDNQQKIITFLLVRYWLCFYLCLCARVQVCVCVCVLRFSYFSLTLFVV